MTTAEEWVERFAAITAQCLDWLRELVVGFDRELLGGLSFQLREGEPSVKEGVLPGVGEFQVHGRGCRFELDDGSFVDVDWDSEGRAVFDSWRVLMFARSSGDESVTRADIRTAMGGSGTIWHVEDDWYTWADRSYDVTWGEPD